MTKKELLDLLKDTPSDNEIEIQFVLNTKHDYLKIEYMKEILYKDKIYFYAEQLQEVSKDDVSVCLLFEATD